MNRGFAIVVSLAVLAALSLVAAHSQEDMTVVPADDFIGSQRPPSVFRHDEHNEKAGIDACNLCHHVYEDGKLVEDDSSEGQRCSDCHGMEDSGRQPGLRKAYHLNCKGCHQERKKGPVMCGECHVRQ